MLTVIIYHPQLSVFSSIPSCCCILISHLSTVPVSSAPVLSVKGHSGPPSRVHTFSREINGLSLQLLPLSFFVICRHWLGGCLQKVNMHSASYGDWKQMGAPLVLMNSEIGGCVFVSVFFSFFFCDKQPDSERSRWSRWSFPRLRFRVCKIYIAFVWVWERVCQREREKHREREALWAPASVAKCFLLIRFNFTASRGGVSGRFV